MKRQQDWRGSRKSEEDDPFQYRGFLQCECDGKLVCLSVRSGNYYCCTNVIGRRQVNTDGSIDCRIASKTCRTPRVRAEYLDEEMSKTVVDHISDPEFISEMLENQRMEADRKEVKKRIASIERQIEETQKKLKRLRTAWLDGDYVDDRGEHDAAKERLLHQLDEQKRLLRECVPAIPNFLFNIWPICLWNSSGTSKTRVSGRC